MPDLSRRRERERLAIRHTPYFRRIGRGAFLGFRRGPDTWSARFRTRDGKQAHKFLGGPLEFDEAKRQAEAWLAQLSGSAVRSVKRSTVREALEAYLADLLRHGRPDTAYSFRHARISELLQIYGVDPITVAAQTGTSVAMIEKAYLRFIPSAMQEKLAALKG